MKTFKFSLVLRTRENTDVFIALDGNIYGIHSKRVNILYLYNWWCILFGIVIHHVGEEGSGYFVFAYIILTPL